VTGYERQHRKNFSYVPVEGADAQTTDQYTKLITHVANMGCIHEQKSKAKELSTISGMVLAQPYLDYTDDDQAQGTLKVKIWEYNAFLVDPYFRSPDMSDCQFVWCQEYISKKEAENRFPDKMEAIVPMAGTPQRYGSFYFLPENYNMARNDLLVLSYVWYKWKRKKKRLYSRSRNQFFDFAGDENNLEQILYNIPDMELVNVEVPCWKLAVVLNDQLMFQGDNPLGFDGCPFIPYFWNYEPHINYYDLRVRSLVRTMRDPQFLYNYKVITNNDIAAATINAGWKRKIGAVANEDNLKKSGQGWDVIINEGYELADCEKIIPSAVPESDLALAQQMDDLIWKTSGFNLENWSGQQDKQISSFTMMLKQAANLMVFQKYFDQWDYADKLLGDRLIQIALNNWNAEKVKLFIGEEPTAFFYSKIFCKYQVIVEESDLTPTQQNLQAQQMMDINAQFQREVFPPSMIIPKLNITGKGEIVPYLQQQEQQMQQMQQMQSQVQQMAEDAKIKELYSRATSNIAMAKERAGRFDANVGLLEERLSEISKNQSLSTKSKMEALEKMIDVIAKYGEIETLLKIHDIETLNYQETIKEDQERQKAKHTSEGTEFLEKIMGNIMPMQQQQNNRQNQQQML
jgi:GTP-sensing pleiotropic transcriptional regulator CodY